MNRGGPSHWDSEWALDADASLAGGRISFVTAWFRRHGTPIS